MTKQYKKQIWVFSFNNGDYTQADAIVCDRSDHTSEVLEKIYKHLENEYQYSRDFVEIIEQFPLMDELVSEVLKGEK